MYQVKRGAQDMFQLTRPRGTRLSQPLRNFASQKFQLTRPRGTRRVFRGRRKAPELFQLTRPRGTRLLLFKSNPLGVCFNLRVREGRDITAI